MVSRNGPNVHPPMPPDTAQIFARVLAGHHVNGELSGVDAAWLSMARYLCDVKAGDPQIEIHGLQEATASARGPAWQAMMAARPDRRAIEEAIANADPECPLPEEPRRRAAHLGDLVQAQSAGRFAWPNWLVRGHVNLLSSDPKVGKTHLALDWARRIWFGEPWPDGPEPTFPAKTCTLWICGDRHQDELRERAQAFGLPNEAVCLNATQEEPYGGWNLDVPGNVELLRELVESERPALVVIDTLWRATRRKLHREDEVNELMNPIVGIAQECGVAVLALMHLSKDRETLGRRLEGLARSILKLERPDPGEPHRRRLTCAANHKEPPALGVTIRDGGCDYDSSPPDEPRSIRPGPAPKKTEACMAWLKEFLSIGPQPISEVIQAGKEQGFPKATMYDAKGRLNVIANEMTKPKTWELLSEEPLDDPDDVDF